VNVAVCAVGPTSPLQPTNSISAAVIRRSGMSLDSFMSEPLRHPACKSSALLSPRVNECISLKVFIPKLSTRVNNC